MFNQDKGKAEAKYLSEIPKKKGEICKEIMLYTVNYIHCIY